jgi:hypothetical protein
VSAFSVVTEVSAERVSDLLCCAFEGGINDWSHKGVRLNPSGDKWPGEWASDMPKHEGCWLEVHDSADTERWFVLDQKALSYGLKLMAEKYPKHWGDFLAENEDAATGDVFVQLCLFGEVKYG